MADGQVLGDQQQEPLGWRAGLPDDLKNHEALKPYKTVGDFAKAHIETATKAKEFEGKLAGSIPKLKEGATPEEREQYLTSLGRPAKPDEYELDGEDRNAKEWTGYWRNELFKIGVPKDQAKAISTAFNTQINNMVQAHNAQIAQSNTEAESKLKTELGDKYTASVELAKRLWKRDTDTELDTAFAGESSANRVAMMRYILKIAAKTGEDMSSLGSQSKPNGKQGGPFDFSKSPAPPPRRV